MINAWAAALTNEDLSRELHYAGMKGIEANKRLGDVIMHLFNQPDAPSRSGNYPAFPGEDVGITDLIALIPNQD